MYFYPKKIEDLLSKEEMKYFFEKKVKDYFFAKKLISLKIFPKKTLSKNTLILYKLSLLKKNKKISKKIWGKTTKEGEFRLLNFFSKKEVGKYFPKCLEYFPSLKFCLFEDVEGKSIRFFRKNLSFWEKNISKISQILSKIQKTKIPPSLLKVHTKEKEKVFLENWLKKIRNYSSKEEKKYQRIKNYYFKNLSSKCWKERSFTFCHFDFQPSNIFFIKKNKSFVILDFDLAERFHPALDLANFWVHFYVMSRYYFSQKKVLWLCGKFLNSYFQNKPSKNFLSYFNLFRLRTILDIAQITASVFKKPCLESERVFEKLDEILKICL
jgi:tRNA A-37 threonylcarbamoyl transferase component Bud32